MSNNKFTYSGVISALTFNLAGDAEILKDSVAHINFKNLYDSEGVPYNNGLNSLQLGTTDYAFKCNTCLNTKQTCMGHEGHIELNYPVYNILVLNDVKKWLKVICFNCGKVVLDKKIYANIPESARLDEVAKKTSSGDSKKCVHCGTLKALITSSATDKLIFKAIVKENKTKGDPMFLFPHQVQEIFHKVSDETILDLGKKLSMHPRKMTLNVIKVIPPSARPDVRQPNLGKSTVDGITLMYQSILRDNLVLPKNITEFNKKMESQVSNFLKHYYALIKGDTAQTNGKETKSFASVIKSKKGIIRMNLLSKRSRDMARSTIAGDPTLELKQVGIPVEFAKVLQIEETVKDFNIDKLMVFVRNGLDKYPGCTRIIKKSGKNYAIGAENVNLEVDDVLMRDIIDGDSVGINRAPSLTISATTTLNVVVDIKNNLTVRFNPLICAYFGADFDGDQMNVIVNKKIYSINEVRELSSAKNWLVSHTNGVPLIGQANDSVIGMFELTKADVKIDRFHAMCLFQNSNQLPALTQPTYTGRDITTLLLRDTPINMSKGTSYYVESLARWVDYDPTDIKVVIKNGVHISGVMDKKTVGGKTENGLYHIVVNEYGTEKALNLIYDMQQVSLNFLNHKGATIGINDIILTQASKLEVDRTITDIFAESQLLTDKLNAGAIIPPLNQTVDEFYEAQQIQILQTSDKFDESILKSIDFNNNNLFKMVASGTKGKMDHMYNIMSSNGLKTINGKRMDETFGYKRSLCYFRRYDTTPESRGYIANSYVAGLNAVGLIYGSMAARFDIFVKAFSTADTGEQNRKSIKNLESAISSNTKATVKADNIVQFVYGEDYLDSRKTIKVAFPTAMMANAQFEKLKYVGVKNQSTFDAEFKLMVDDRAKYRDIYLTMEVYDNMYRLPNEKLLAIDIQRVITNVLANKSANTNTTKLPIAPPTEAQLVVMVGIVREFCEYAPYMYSNTFQYESRSALPQYMYDVAWLICMSARYYLCASNLVANSIDEIMLKSIIDAVKFKYLTSLIDAGVAVGIIAGQSFSEPLTQYMLDAHRRSASGGTSKAKMTRIKELLSAKAANLLLNATMTIEVLPEFAKNKAKVQEIANQIELLLFVKFVKSWQIFFEPFGAPMHSKYEHEFKMIETFTKANPLIPPPKDLSKWCIRFQIDKSALIIKNMPLITITQRLFSPATYIVYTAENVKDIIIRVYIRANADLVNTEETITALTKQLLTTIVRGYTSIATTQVVSLNRSCIDATTGAIVKDELFGIQTTGTNFRDVACHKFIKWDAITTNAVQELATFIGIEAARQKIIFELKEGVDECSFKHLSLYADEMTFTGKITGIEKKGLIAREPKNLLLHMGFSSPYQVLEKAVIGGKTDKITGVSSKLIIGDTPRYGTLYNQFSVNEDMIRENIKSADDYIDNL